MQAYFAEIERKVRTAYSIAEEARSKGLDPISIVEIQIAASLAERVTGLIAAKYPQINDQRIVKRIKELEKDAGIQDPVVAFKIAEEVASENFCKFTSQIEAIDAGIRLGMAYLTLGVVSSPLEGFTELQLKKTKHGQDYFSPYFSGPIRSAGGTAAALSVVLVDYLREKFGYAKYDPTIEEIKRASTELYDYHEWVTNLQYLPSEKEIEFLSTNIPVQVSGEPSEKKEASNYKDLKRIETNFLRSGFCLVLAEGLLQKAPKVLKTIKKLNKAGIVLSDWGFLEDLIKMQKKGTQTQKPGESTTFIKDIVAGRPVLTYPSRAGGFRLRYGKTRCSGFSAVAINSFTQRVLDNFIAFGTQIKTERPGKSAAVTTCDDVEGPILLLEDGSLVKPKNIEELNKAKEKLKEIVYLGDILVSYGDFFNRNHPLMPCGYNEEYWFVELKYKAKEQRSADQESLENINPFDVSFEQAQELSSKFNVPLHPKYTFFWSQITKEDFLEIISWLSKAEISDKILLPYRRSKLESYAKAKRALEILGVEHLVATEDILIDADRSKALLLNLGLLSKNKEELNFEKLEMIKSKEGSVLELINSVCPFAIKDLAGTFIGARMGRPEKAKLRKLIGSPNVLFPVGEEGGRFRSVQEATEGKMVQGDFPIYHCDKCNKDTIYYVCEDCREKTRKLFYCKECGEFVNQDEHNSKFKDHNIQSYTNREVNIDHYLKKAMSLISLEANEMPELIKGVKGTSSADHVPENLAKGILRSKFNLCVNKDGTIRYDLTELPMTHFKPKEIGTSIEKLKEFGYTHDMNNKPLTEDNQIVELKPQDLVLPSCPESQNEKADELLINIANFIDHLLVRFYKMPPFYNASSAEDLIGQLVICIAPHNAAGVAARIIGFSKTQTLLATPYIHAAVRRDADGDELAIILLLDGLLNFSRYFLPAHRGGTQDAPLILNARIKAGEVDDMVFDIETVKELPYELYQGAELYALPSMIKIEQISDRIKEGHEFKDLYYTHSLDNISSSVLCSAYKTLATMKEKVDHQLGLAEKIRAVDASDVARLVIERHLIRDIKGNLRKFSMQQFRCVKCNKKYRRPPLAGKCTCGGRIMFTISEGSIVKYLEPAISLATKYDVPEYIKQTLELTKRRIESLFGKDVEKQEALKKWF